MPMYVTPAYTIVKKSPNFQTFDLKSQSLYFQAFGEFRSRRRLSSYSVSPVTPPSKPSQKTYLPEDGVRYDQVGHCCKILDRSGKKNCAKYPIANLKHWLIVLNAI